MTVPAIAIVIPVRNDATRLRRCLEAISGNTGSDRAIVIVADNGSTDGSVVVAEAAGARVLALPRRRVGELRNIACRESDAPLIAFIDADHIIDHGWIEAALQVLEDRGIAAAGAPYASPDTANPVQRAYDRLRPVITSRTDVDWLGSGNLIVRRDAFERVDGFDTTLEACEDVDLCNRLRGAGFRLVADPRLRSVHLGDPASIKAVFRGELWRGRDNMRVTLRGPLTVRALPSLAIPIINLACVVAVPFGAWAGWALPFGAVAVFAALVALRAARMTISRWPLRLADVAANLSVAAAYDLARALSLVARATHRTRHRAAGARAVA